METFKEDRCMDCGREDAKLRAVVVVGPYYMDGQFRRQMFVPPLWAIRVMRCRWCQGIETKGHRTGRA